MKKMLQFVDEARNACQRSTIKRKDDFKEIYDEFIKDKAESSPADVHNVVFLFARYIVL